MRQVLAVILVLFGACAFAKSDNVGTLAQIYRSGGSSWIVRDQAVASDFSALLPSPQLNQSGFTLAPANPFNSEREQNLFSFDLDSFLTAEQAADYTDAAKIFVGRLGFDDASFQYKRPYPYLKAWGAMFHPPSKQVLAIAKIDRRLALPFDFREKKYATPDFQNSLDQSSGSELTSDNALELIHNGQTLTPLVGLVKNARQFVLVQVLALSCDEQSSPLISALEERARAGVDVRVLVHKMYALLAQSCIKRLETSGVQVAKEKIHSTYFVNDQDELMIGAQSISKTFFSSTGFNFLDRDSMLAVKGPVATDAVREFAAIWERARNKNQKDISALVGAVKAKRSSEIASGLRGAAHYGDWLKSAPVKGLCRFAVQHPSGENRGLENLMISYLGASRSMITGSSVKFLYPLHEISSVSRVAGILKDKARSGVSVDLFGNGFDGGDGELTMLLNEKSENLEPRHPIVAALAEKINKIDVNKQAKVNFRQFHDLTSVPGLTVWTYFNFTHYKIWSFDRGAILVTSLNFDTKSFDALYESGVICSDEKLRSEFESQEALDRLNSTPYFNGSF